MSDYVVTPSSDESTNPDARRKCDVLQSRMSSIKHDKHSLCSTCRGGDCDFENKCHECLSWAKDVVDNYFKHYRH